MQQSSDTMKQARLTARAGFLAGILALACVAATGHAQSIDTPAKQALMIDVETGAVMLEKNADAPMHPASMSKLMTLYMVFERLKKKTLSLDDTFLVSEKAWRMQGSKMFVDINSRVKVQDLLMGIIVQSGNDACLVIAEGLSGSEATFADEMTRRGRELGLTNSVFKNSTGWPDPEHMMTARDIARLSKIIIDEFPEYYKWFSETNYTYNKIKQGNRNPLLYSTPGSDGLKTGHTEESGYGLAASVVREGRRIILVVNGLSSMRERSQETARLVDWGFSTFRNYALFKSGTTVDSAPVWLGTEPSVTLVTERDLTITLPRKARSDLKVKVVYDGAIPAPVKKGAPIARLVISAPDTKPIEMPLVAGADIERLGVFGRMGAALRHLLFGASG
jgi:D-alanyl-D-alanine carboxypeptidase (penicillin-binding protein 5/6)